MPRQALTLIAISQCSEHLLRLQQDTPGVLSATLASADGLTVASTLPDSQEADRLSAMSGSIGALAGALTRETRLDSPELLILEAASGRIVSVVLDTPAGTMVLTVVTNTASLLGKLLWAAKNASEQIAAHLQAPGATAPG